MKNYTHNIYIYMVSSDSNDEYQLLNDNQYFEGFMGALGTMVSFFVFRKIFDLNKNMGIVLGLTFISTWLIRKMGMSIYYQVKKDLKQENKTLNISNYFNLSDVENPKQIYYIVVISVLLFIGVVSTLTARKVISPVNIAIYLLYCVGFMSLVHYSE
uniref:Uncharacterized protein n=1 Tax=viral metagenome TaxID=1070528 RepID=A0A6C0EG97_9ZZZZ